MTPTALLRTPHHAHLRDHPQLVEVSRLPFAEKADRLNHNVFRYPAKFHPPVARALIEGYTRPGETVLDPFCGSGTTLVEALVSGRSGVGTDVDPLAVLVTKAKIRRYDLEALEATVSSLRDRLTKMRDADVALWGGMENEIPQCDFASALPALAEYVPALPRMDHWFRRRVVLQLAAIRGLAEAEPAPGTRDFLRLCFAAIIRNASNADPVPVSGLEVTSHMRAKEANGRSIDPYGLFATALNKNLAAMRDFEEARHRSCYGRAAIADARHLSECGTGPVDAVITSPPYLTAVDYYRRHTLEMYWLGLTSTDVERLELLPRYIGRDKVGQRHLSDEESESGMDLARTWLPHFGDIKPERARAFTYYCIGMSKALARLSELVAVGGPVVIVVGNVRFTGKPVSMVDLMIEAAPPRLQLAERLWYPLANRFMSYSRKNEADIDSDHVLVFRRRG